MSLHTAVYLPLRLLHGVGPAQETGEKQASINDLISAVISVPSFYCPTTDFVSVQQMSLGLQSDFSLGEGSDSFDLTFVFLHVSSVV